MVVAATGVNLAEADGTCGERILAYHEAQARGGVGMVIEGVTSVAWPVGANTDFQVALSDDRFIPGPSAETPPLPAGALPRADILAEVCESPPELIANSYAELHP